MNTSNTYKHPYNNDTHIQVHMHVRVIPMASVPREDQALQKWILGVFEEKDELLEHYKVHGCFPGILHLPVSVSMSVVTSIVVFV